VKTSVVVQAGQMTVYVIGAGIFVAYTGPLSHRRLLLKWRQALVNVGRGGLKPRRVRVWYRQLNRCRQALCGSGVCHVTYGNPRAIGRVTIRE
jgi:hypothetical protein